MKKFKDLVIVEVAGSVAGAYAGKLYSDYGAQVVKVEPAPGDPSRSTGPLLGSGISAEFAYLNTGKSSLELDSSSPAGHELLRVLCSTADVLIESFSPGPPAPLPDAITASAESIRVRISPFGLTGPSAGHRSTPFTDFAAAGHMYLTGEPDREPLQGAPNQSLYASGAHAFIGSLAALFARERTGRGQDIDVSHFEVMTSLHQWTTVRFTHGGVIQRRVGNRYGSLHPSTIYECNDGYVAFAAVGNEPLSRVLAVIGMEDLLDDPRFSSGAARFTNADAFDALLEPWMKEHAVHEVVELGQAVRAPVAPVNSIEALLTDPHLAARGFWSEIEGSPDGLRYPGPPFRMSGHEWALKPAPQIGEGTSALLPELTSDPQTAGRGEIVKPPSNAGPARGALDGVTILDLTRVWAGPLATRILGDLGADVIKIEATWARGPKHHSEADVRVSGRYPDNQAGEKPWNREGMFNKLNRNKRSVTLQLDTPEGKALFERLVPLADVVIENYTPRVMPQLGLGYERLRELNPSVVYLSMPGYGWSGPSRDFAALGTALEPEAGLSSLMGYEDSGPYKSGVAWADPVAAMHGAAAVILGLIDRDASPDRAGQAIELAQIEGMVCFIGGEVLAAQTSPGAPGPRGNRHRFHAPQGCYPCAGDDRWIALTITSDGEWRNLCDLAGFESALGEMTLPQRYARSPELDERIAAWTCARDRGELEAQLQARGVAAAAVNDARDLVENAHLRARDYFADIVHPDAGRHLFPGLPIKLSETPARYARPAPGLGQHNREVLQAMLGISDDELALLLQKKVIADEPPG